MNETHPPIPPSTLPTIGPSVPSSVVALFLSSSPLSSPAPLPSPLPSPKVEFPVGVEPTVGQQQITQSTKQNETTQQNEQQQTQTTTNNTQDSNNTHPLAYGPLDPHGAALQAAQIQQLQRNLALQQQQQQQQMQQAGMHLMRQPQPDPHPHLSPPYYPSSQPPPSSVGGGFGAAFSSPPLLVQANHMIPTLPPNAQIINMNTPYYQQMYNPYQQQASGSYYAAPNMPYGAMPMNGYSASGYMQPQMGGPMPGMPLHSSLYPSMVPPSYVYPPSVGSYLPPVGFSSVASPSTQTVTGQSQVTPTMHTYTNTQISPSNTPNALVHQMASSPPSSQVGQTMAPKTMRSSSGGVGSQLKSNKLHYSSNSSPHAALPGLAHLLDAAVDEVVESSRIDRSASHSSVGVKRKHGSGSYSPREARHAPNKHARQATADITPESRRHAARRARDRISNGDHTEDDNDEDASDHRPFDDDEDEDEDGDPDEDATSLSSNEIRRSGGYSARGASLLNRSELACGSIRALPGSKVLNFRSVIRCGSFDAKAGQWVQNLRLDYFHRDMDVYTADADPKKRPLVRASTLADKFNCATNKIGMYLARRRTVMDGIYQATEFTHKPSGKTGLKVGGYFLTLEACKDFESHYWQHKEKKHGSYTSIAIHVRPIENRRPPNTDSRGRPKKRATQATTDPEDHDHANADSDAPGADDHSSGDPLDDAAPSDNDDAEGCTSLPQPVKTDRDLDDDDDMRSPSPASTSHTPPLTSNAVADASAPSETKQEPQQSSAGGSPTAQSDSTPPPPVAALPSASTSTAVTDAPKDITIKKELADSTNPTTPPRTPISPPTSAVLNNLAAIKQSLDADAERKRSVLGAISPNGSLSTSSVSFPPSASPVFAFLRSAPPILPVIPGSSLSPLSKGAAATAPGATSTAAPLNTAAYPLLTPKTNPVGLWNGISMNLSNAPMMIHAPTV